MATGLRPLNWHVADGWRGAIISCNAFSNYGFTPSLLTTFRAHHPGFLTHVRGSWLKPVVGDFGRDSPFQFSPLLVIPLLQAPSPWFPDSCAGFLTQSCGWRLSSWLTVSVFTSPSDSSSSGPITLGSWLICGVPDSNLWLATLVVTHRFSFHLS